MLQISICLFQLEELLLAILVRVLVVMNSLRILSRKVIQSSSLGRIAFFRLLCWQLSFSPKNFQYSILLFLELPETLAPRLHILIDCGGATESYVLLLLSKFSLLWLLVTWLQCVWRKIFLSWISLKSFMYWNVHVLSKIWEFSVIIFKNKPISLSSLLSF